MTDDDWQMHAGHTSFRRPWRVPSSQPGDLRRLAIFLAASLLLGHLQARQQEGRTFLRDGVSAVAVPIIAALSSAANNLHHLAAALPRVSALAAENRRLRTQVAELQRGQVALAEALRERQRLRAMLGLRPQVGEGAIAAAVIGRQLSRSPTSIMIDKGYADGVRVRQPVIAAGGLVGRICQVAANSALAIPLTDRNSSAGAMVQRSREVGILQGEGELCRLNYLPLHADVRPGDNVISSGLGGIFPKGLPIGVVVEAHPDETVGVKWALVHPHVKVRRLEEVLVMRQ